MKEIEITRWQRLEHEGKAIASFNFTVCGIIIRAAMFRRSGNRYLIDMPFTIYRQRNGDGLTAVGLPTDLYNAVLTAAVERYRQEHGEPTDAGLRRLFCPAVEESLQMAGV